ncbi:hypothetical protein E6P09_10465 [Haloferax mediterranei ATCC 33500]|nr:hypothetical protein [Haloferax mediterranei]AHZ21442.1 hypothetical protein BM92_01705 [Haloferax mediterranei ATCC 33500]EMA03900.1 hypothetical protein C439_03043 [Haloferax mediterranei ATCC 33500]MDX5989296.1 hypothetical protein [Haloferax mediterranei ATCC 33500]QCQ75665.1 hypothetical protein E6P09_10465 [Haloferax mediterranei ATCC 33500]
MMRKLLPVLLACTLVLGVATPVAAASGAANTVSTPVAFTVDTDGWYAANNTTTVSSGNDSAANQTIRVTVGQQLTTIVSQTDSEVRTEMEESAFEVRVASGRDADRAVVIADRAEELEARAEEILDSYEEATEAYESGELTRSEYAQRIATLNARSGHLLRSVEQLKTRSKNVSNESLSTAGFDDVQLQTIDDELDTVTGSGTEALLKHFTGLATGTIEIETTQGVSISVESEGGETSREIERERDNDTTFSINESAALDMARNELRSPSNGSWSLLEGNDHDNSGYYEFEFELTGGNFTGDAEVRVDGSSGTVFRLESEVKSPDFEGPEAEHEDGRDEADEENEADEEDQEKSEDSDDGFGIDDDDDDDGFGVGDEDDDDGFGVGDDDDDGFGVGDEDDDDGFGIDDEDDDDGFGVGSIEDRFGSKWPYKQTLERPIWV